MRRREGKGGKKERKYVEADASDFRFDHWHLIKLIQDVG